MCTSLISYFTRYHHLPRQYLTYYKLQSYPCVKKILKLPTLHPCLQLAFRSTTHWGEGCRGHRAPRPSLWGVGCWGRVGRRGSTTPMDLVTWCIRLGLMVGFHLLTLSIWLSKSSQYHPKGKRSAPIVSMDAQKPAGPKLTRFFNFQHVLAQSLEYIFLCSTSWVDSQ